jgi:hypothetical protein
MVDKIGVNIWDDFYDVGDAPEGEVQGTYAYIESREISEEDKKNVLELIKKTIEDNKNPKWSFEFFMDYHDSTKIYPNLVGTEHEWCLYKRWQLEFRNFSHEVLEEVLEMLQKQNLSYQGTPLDIYSES